LQVRAEETHRSDNVKDVKANSLAVKVMKMKEEITKATIERCSAMHDREERAALATAIASLKRADHEQALKILTSRLTKVERKLSFRKRDSDSEEDSDCDDAPALSADASKRSSTVPDDAGESHGGETCNSSELHGAIARHNTACMSKEEWLEAVGRYLSISDDATGPEIKDEPNLQTMMQGTCSKHSHRR
jgi:hypothetical protein